MDRALNWVAMEASDEDVAPGLHKFFARFKTPEAMNGLKSAVLAARPAAPSSGVQSSHHKSPKKPETVVSVPASAALAFASDAPAAAPAAARDAPSAAAAAAPAPLAVKASAAPAVPAVASVASVPLSLAGFKFGGGGGGGSASSMSASSIAGPASPSPSAAVSMAHPPATAPLAASSPIAGGRVISKAKGRRAPRPASSSASAAVHDDASSSGWETDGSIRSGASSAAGNDDPSVVAVAEPEDAGDADMSHNVTVVPLTPVALKQGLNVAPRHFTSDPSAIVSRSPVAVDIFERMSPSK
jgi:hypothetical protein